MPVYLLAAARAAGLRSVQVAAALACLAVQAGCSAPQVVESQSADLPVTKVVLYQNGVGYFERHGTVRGRDVELRVRPDQINDVLKSLTVLDLSGSVAASVSLPVERSGDELAAQLPAQVRSISGIQGLLTALRGAQVQVEGSAGSFAGKVVGVERGDGLNGEGKTEQVLMLTLLSANGTLTSVPLSGIGKVVIGDRALALGVEQSLDLARRDGSWKPVAVQIRLADDGSHDLLVSYIHEVPVWRPAYRAWVEEGKGITLQGWAIVDNVSGETWKDVDLTLVVGSPLSFRYDLHTPHKVVRPDLSSRLPQGAEAPPEAEAGYVAPMDDLPSPPPPPPSAGAGPRPASRPQPSYKKSKGERAPAAAPQAEEAEMARDSGYERARAQQENARRDAAMQQAQALVTGREVGALYTYQAQRPVTVPDRSAALINIVSRKIEGQDVFLFREPSSGQSPYRAVLLRNGKQSALEAGPITLYVDGTFAGEGFIARLGKDEVTFVPYARESGLALNLDYTSKTDELRLVRIVDSRITLQGKQRHTRTVRLASNREQPSVAYVRLPRIRGTQIINPPKDLVQTGDDVYVPVAVGAKAKVEVAFVEETPISVVEAGLTSPVIAALRFYLDNSRPQDAIAGPIRDVLATHEEIAKIQIDLQNLAEQRDTLDHEQRRIQGNLDSLPPGAVAADLRKKLVAQLEDASKRAAEVAKRIVEDQVKLAALNEKFRELLRRIDLRAAGTPNPVPAQGVARA